MNKADIFVKKYILSGLIVFVFLISVIGLVIAAAAPNNTSYSYAIVEFNESAIGASSHGQKLNIYTSSNAAALHRLQNVHANFNAWLHSNAPWATSISNYYYTLDGVAVQYTGNNLNALASGPDVKSVTPDWLYKPVMDASVPLISANQVWSAMGINPSGQDLAKIKVGVIDSGIDTSNPFISSCRTNNPVIHEQFYSGDVGYNPANAIVVAHGTHVSGTIGGCYTTAPVNVGGKMIQLQGPISGVAPGVTLHDYNVFPGFGVGYYFKQGSAFSHDIANAVEKAVLDGMNIISLSLGGTPNGPHDVLAESINNAVDSGVVAVVAAGNSGAGVPLSIESPGSAANAITVAASSNSHLFAGTKITFGSNTVYAVEGDFKTFDPPMTAATSTTVPADGCSAISTDLTGKIALIDRGACYFTDKVDNAQAAGAVGVIIVNNVAGPAIPMAQSPTPNYNIPAVMVSQTDGALLKANAPNQITVDSTGLYELQAVPDVMASFSSLGPTPFSYITKPDVAAPGVNILSSVFDGQFAVYQGTSMATPHVTGVAALLLAAHPDMTPAEVKSAIVNYADRNTNLDLGSLSGIAFGPLAMGGGRVNALSSYDAQVFSSPSSISFGGYTGGAPISTSNTLTFENTQDTPVTLSFSLDSRYGVNNIIIDPKAPTDYYLAPWQASNFISFSSSSLTIAAHSSASVTVSFDSGRTLQYTGWSFGYVDAHFGTSMLHIPWSIIFQQHSGALNGIPGSGILADPIFSQYYNPTSSDGGLTN